MAFVIRAVATVLMIGLFLTYILLGHMDVIIMMTIIPLISFKEVLSLINVASQVKSLRVTKSFKWYLLGTIIYYLYGESLISYFKSILEVDTSSIPLAVHHHPFVSFMLYIFGKCFFCSHF